MSERDRDFFTLAALIAMLAAVTIAQARIMRGHAETLIRHDEDIVFLRLVARGLEEKVADD